MLDPNPERRRRAVGLMKSEPLILDNAAREIVAATFVDHCRIRNWRLLAKAVRTNHAHVVIENAGVTPERMMTELKGYSTRRLRRAGIVGKDQEAWVYHGSTRYLWTPQKVESTIAYVELGQD